MRKPKVYNKEVLNKTKDKNKRFKEFMACTEEEENMIHKREVKRSKSGDKESVSRGKKSCL